ncbi:hypothetical protein [Anoxynatronum buryatiense]|uniref:Vitamin B12 dependent methionine synthase n=1 Tax=Anoxynatronum buryatiense TaxID=489973 RepID=A0AA45WTE2_9CLOT|nr:hypothetical protein [Anoxynatronum buryatiense]SMP40904.1 hypothetical protein SAMN06296020_101433 [Anoxynatronum buryatiense]
MPMDAVTVTSISFTLSRSQLAARLAIPEASPRWNRVMALARQAESIGGLGGAYLPVTIDHTGDGFIIASGIRINSRILQEQTEHRQLIFPFLATCGRPLEAWAQSFTGITDRYVAEVMTEIACMEALENILSEVDTRYCLTNASMVNPGSLEDWPLTGQTHIFEFLHQAAAGLGVTLSPDWLMSPLKSMSGIRFSGKTLHLNCAHCPRKACVGRRELYENPC